MAATEFDAGLKAGEQAAAIDSLEMRIAALERKVDQVLERVTLARGGIAVLIALGSFAAAIAGAIVLWVHGGRP